MWLLVQFRKINAKKTTEGRSSEWRRCDSCPCCDCHCAESVSIEYTFLSAEKHCFANAACSLQQADLSQTLLVESLKCNLSILTGSTTCGKQSLRLELLPTEASLLRVKWRRWKGLACRCVLFDAGVLLLGNVKVSLRNVTELGWVCSVIGVLCKARFTFVFGPTTALEIFSYTRFLQRVGDSFDLRCSSWYRECQRR